MNTTTDTSPLRVLVMGPSTYWVELVARMLVWQGHHSEVFQPKGRLQLTKWLLSGRWRRYDVIYHVGGPSTDWPANLVISLVGKPVVWHWIGSDVLRYIKQLQVLNWRERIMVFLARTSKIHLSDSPELAEELQTLGIQAKMIRLLPEKIDVEMVPLPETVTVLSYWSDGHKLFYGGDIVLQLAQDFPEIEFIILGATQDDTPEPNNVKFLGRLEDIEPVYARSSVLIRLPAHDSLSAMVLEMLARGRYIIYNKPLPHCHLAHDYATAKKALTEIIQKKSPNRNGALYVRENFSPTRQADLISQLCCRLPYRKTNVIS